MKPMLGNNLLFEEVFSSQDVFPRMSVVALFFHNDDALVIAWIYIRPCSELSCRQRSRASGVIDARFWGKHFKPVKFRGLSEATLGDDAAEHG